MSAQPAPAIYADCLFNTNLLPATVTGSNTQVYNKNVAPGTIINGAAWSYVDPEDQATLINNINQFISLTYYGSGFGGYVCSGPTAAVKPCRYVIMHGSSQTPPQSAHELLVDGSGNATYINTNWTS